MLEYLHQDHNNMFSIIKLLKSRVKALENGNSSQLWIIFESINYLHQYSDRCHHKLEDVVYQRYLNCYSTDAQVNKLACVHETLEVNTKALLETMSLIMNDIVVDKAELIRQLNQFVEQQEQHILYEERVIFPLIKSKLNAADWKAIRECTGSLRKTDPLFGPISNTEFHQLKQYLLMDQLDEAIG